MGQPKENQGVASVNPYHLICYKRKTDLLFTVIFLENEKDVKSHSSRLREDPTIEEVREMSASMLARYGPLDTGTIPPESDQ